MAVHIDSIKQKLGLLNLFSTLKFRIDFAREHPDFFDADGLVCFCGGQGSGKTLSAVNYVCKLMDAYPKSILVTNIMINDYPIVTYDEWKELNKERFDALFSFAHDDDIVNSYMEWEYRKTNRVFPFYDNDDLTKYDNDERGVIFLIDEIQLYMNSLESKNINMDVMTQISQQRKQRKHIVATSQVFGRMAKPLREQFSDVIICKCFLRLFQWNKLVNRDDIEDVPTSSTVTGVCKRRFFWFHHPSMYRRYDTYFVIEKGKFIANENKKGEIYSVDRLSSDS